jgi:hypothetical protein
MSARKKVNQSRPRAFARAAASRVAGAVCFDAADDAKPPSTRRSSRPPSNSSANADSSMSPAPSGIYGVGFWPSAPCNRPPLSLFSAAPHRVMPDKGRRSCLYQIQRVRKRGNFEKSPVSSTDFGIMRRRDFSRKSGIYRSSSIPTAIWNFYARVPVAAHGGARCSSPIRLVIHPDEPIRSLEAAAKVIRRRSSRSQGGGTAASDQGRLDAGRGRRRRQGLSRLVRSGRPAAGPAGRRRARLNETRPPPRGFARRRVKIAWCRRLTCARESRRSP